METVTLQAIVIYLVTEFGVGGLSVLLLANLDSIKDGWFASLTYGWKRAVSIAVAALIISVVWGFGLWAHYFSVPEPTPLAWLEAWVQMIAPAGLLQQLLHGATKKPALKEPSKTEDVSVEELNETEDATA